MPRIRDTCPGQCTGHLQAQALPPAAQVLSPGAQVYKRSTPIASAAECLRFAPHHRLATASSLQETMSSLKYIISFIASQTLTLVFFSMIQNV